MQAESSPRQANNILSWVIAVLGVALLLLLLLSFVAESRPPAAGDVSGVGTERLAYLEFGTTADTLWLADTSSPDERAALLTIPHAAQYGAIPAVSPDGSRFAYTALPESTAHPKPDSPAELWVASIQGDAGPVLLAESVDLLVEPVWAPDGESVIYRRSTGSEHVLAMTGAAGGEERELARSGSESLFPIALTPDGGAFYFAGLSDRGGTNLYSADPATGSQRTVAFLSPGLTRDWALSPDGTRLAFLEIAFTEAEVVSRAAVLELATGTVTRIAGGQELALGPTWSEGGELTLGVFDPVSGEASLLHLDGAKRSQTDGPPTGFDVPFAYDAATDSYIVRAFENDSITDPGRSTLMLVGRDGERKLIAEGETSLVGWTHP